MENFPFSLTASEYEFYGDSLILLYSPSPLISQIFYITALLLKSLHTLFHDHSLSIISLISCICISR